MSVPAIRCVTLFKINIIRVERRIPLTNTLEVKKLYASHSAPGICEFVGGVLFSSFAISLADIAKFAMCPSQRAA